MWGGGKSMTSTWFSASLMRHTHRHTNATGAEGETEFHENVGQNQGDGGGEKVVVALMALVAAAGKHWAAAASRSSWSSSDERARPSWSSNCKIDRQKWRTAGEAPGW